MSRESKFKINDSNVIKLSEDILLETKNALAQQINFLGEDIKKMRKYFDNIHFDDIRADNFNTVAENFDDIIENLDSLINYWERTQISMEHNYKVIQDFDKALNPLDSIKQNKRKEQER